MAFKVFTKNNYFLVVDTDTNTYFEEHKFHVIVSKYLTNSTAYSIFFREKQNEFLNIPFASLQDEAGNAFASTTAFEDFYTANTGFNAVSQGQLTAVQIALQANIDAKTDKTLTRSRKTASYVATLSDADTLIEMNVATANTLTINANVFSDGKQLMFEQYGAGETTIVAGAGMTIRSNGSKYKASGQYAGGTLVFKSSTEATIYGNLKA